MSSFDACFDFAPVYELVLSIRTYMNRHQHKSMDLGVAWGRDVQRRIPVALHEQISEWNAKTAFHWNLELFIRNCPGPRDIKSFCQWLASCSSGMLFEYLSAQEEGTVPTNVAELRDACVHVMLSWNEHYFSHVQPEVLERLSEDADAKKAWMEQERIPATDVIERVTGGLRLREDYATKEIVLVPQYHMSPWNNIIEYRGVCFYSYPVDVFPAPPGDPDAGLLRLTKALSDVSRLRILHFIHQQSRSFSEVVDFSGLTKGTVHHHLVLLRAAGLVVLQFSHSGHPVLYEVNPRMMDEVTSRLGGFLSRTH